MPQKFNAEFSGSTDPEVLYRDDIYLGIPQPFHANV